MKKFLLKIIIIIILLTIIIVGISKETKQSIRPDKRNFSITDTVNIEQIRIQNRNLEKIELKRHKDYWILNDSLIANQYSVDLLLKTIKEMRIKNPVARSALNNVLKRMGTQNTKIDFFNKKKHIKTIYVGGETADQLGTFMMIEGAKEPYVVHIPGFNGYLSSRFSCKEKLWRSKHVFPTKIQHIDYTLIQKATKLDGTDNLNWKNSHIKKTQQIYCEQFIENKSITDLKSRLPFMILRAKTINNKYEYLYCVRKKTVAKPKYKDQEFDQERFYGIINNTIMLIQYKQIKQMLQSENILHIIMPWETQNYNSLKEKN